MTDTMSRRVYNISASVSQTHQDIVDERYRDLRRPRKIRFFVNGDRYFRGKKLYITPHRYFNFNDLLNDLTGKLPSNLNLPYGVRQIFTPSCGRRVTDIEDLNDGQTYICAGFEGFRQIKYGKSEMEPWSVVDLGHPVRNARPHKHELDDQNYTTYRTRGVHGSNAFHPGRYFHGSYPHRKWPGTFGTANRHSHLLQSETIPLKPKVITIVRSGQRPRNNVKILLNRRSVQSFEQLMQDISEAFGPKWKNNKVRKLFTTRGHNVQSISDFFRDDDVFIGVGNDPLTENEVFDIVDEFFQDSSYAKSVLRDLEKTRRKRQLHASSKDDHDKRDSGFGEGSDGSNKDPDQEYIIYKGRSKEKGKHRHDYPKEYDLAIRLEREREKAANEERERAQKQQQKMLETERRAMEDERRKRGLVPLKPIEDPFKKIKEQKEREKEEARKLKEEEKMRYLDDERFKMEQERNEKAEQAARERQAYVEKEKMDKLDKEKIHKEKEKLENEKETDEKDKKVKEVKEVKEEKDKIIKDDIEKPEKTEHSSQHKAKRKKSKIVRKTKLDRQVSNDEFVLKQFELGRTLGDGNFAIVRQARLKTTSTDYALKIIDKQKLKGKEHMVENEIDIMKDCHHHNIVKLYEEYETSDKIYLVMELVKGGDLFDAITQSVKFGEVDSAGMVKDLCSALFYLHSRSIVHRDLKPENLLFHRNKDSSITLKLADFGLAMEVKDLIYTVCGTPTYVAPEILSEIGYGIEVDMWAVGVITYILLCGFPPFRSPDRNQTELFEFIKAGEYEFLSPYWDNISASAKDLIENLLVVDRKHRYTAIEVLSHPWITCCGDINPTDNAKTEEHRRSVRKEYEETARRSYDEYQKLKERKARGDFNH